MVLKGSNVKLQLGERDYIPLRPVFRIVCVVVGSQHLDLGAECSFNGGIAVVA